MKFNNIPKRYAGKTYQSTLEARYAQHLDLLKRGGEIQDYKEQVVFRLNINGSHICNYIADFVVTGKYGRLEIHECKSPITKTAVWSVKWKLAQALYPEYKFVVVMRGDF